MVDQDMSTVGGQVGFVDMIGSKVDIKSHYCQYRSGVFFD